MDRFSSAYPDQKLHYLTISPSLFGKVNEFLVIFNRLHKILLELFEKVGCIFGRASDELLSVVETCNRKVGEVTRSMSNTSFSMPTFLNQALNQVGNQAKTLKSLQTRLHNTALKSLRDVVHEKKQIWKTCFRYTDSFSQHLSKEELGLQKCYKQYSETAMKVKPGNTMEKQLQIFHDLHNTYVLKLMLVNSMNDVFYTHTLPYIIHIIEINHGKLNGQYKEHVSDLLQLQTENWNKMVKFNDQMFISLNNLDILSDLKNFIEISNNNVKDKLPSMVHFILPKVDEPKARIFNNLDANFIVSEMSCPNLQRRLASLQQETQELMDIISTKKRGGISLHDVGDSSLGKIIDLLSICDKETKLNVLQKQMNMYTPAIMEFLGPISQNILLETPNSKKSFNDASNAFHGEAIPHEFIEPRVMKPISCFYCDKLIALIGKGYICKVCKVYVHKKCATSVKFCDPLLQQPRTPAFPLNVAGSGKSATVTIRNSFVNDLIDLEDVDDFHDDNEFDDSFSDESNHDYDYYSTKDFDTGTEISKSVAKIPNTQNIDLLSDLLDFHSQICDNQPIYETPSPKILFPLNISDERKASTDLLQSTPLYDQVTPDKQIAYSNISNIHIRPTVPDTPAFKKQSSQKVKPPVPLKPVNVKLAKNQINLISVNSEMSDVLHGKSLQPLVPKKPIFNTKYSAVQAAPSQDSVPNVPLPKNICVSLCDFHGTDATHLSFMSGNKLEILDKSSNEWWYGEFNGCKGYFPSQYVLEICQADVVVRVLYDFSKEVECELDVNAGDILVAINANEKNDWVTVKSKDNQGLVPTSYLEFL